MLLHSIAKGKSQSYSINSFSSAHTSVSTWSHLGSMGCRCRINCSTSRHHRSEPGFAVISSTKAKRRLRTYKAPYLCFDLNFWAWRSSAVARSLFEVLKHLAWLTDVLKLIVSVLSINVLLNRSYRNKDAGLLNFFGSIYHQSWFSSLRILISWQPSPPEPRPEWH